MVGSIRLSSPMVVIYDRGRKHVDEMSIGTGSAGVTWNHAPTRPHPPRV